MDIRYSCNQRDFKRYTTEETRNEMLITGLYKADEMVAVYSHVDRMVTLGCMPVHEEVSIDKGIDVWANFGTHYFLERREIGIFNIGDGAGTVTADGKEYHLNYKDCLYLTKGNQKVTFTYSEIRGLRSMHTNHAGIIVTVSIHNPLRHKGITYRCIQQPGQLPHFLVGSRNNSTATYIDIWLFCFLHQSYCLLYIFFLIFFLYRQCFRLFLLIFKLCRCHILGDIHKNRSRPATSCNRKGLSDRICQNTDILYNIPMLCDRHGYTCNIYLLEGILSKERKIYITGDCYHRYRIHVGRCNTGYKIGCTRSAGCQADTDLAGSPGIPVCRMGCALFMGGQNMSDLITVFIQSIIYIQDRTARITENSIYFLLLQAGNYDLRSC